MSKIERRHLQRKAYVYVRQSTMAQVEHNTESLERQYELTERAVALGWEAREVVVVDDDQGRSGKSADGRDGFQGLVADVGLGRVGIVLGIEVSRLARRNADWYQLLDLCALTDTLIADSDGIYHPGLHNDRLVLGLKGTMSEAELHVLRARLRGGSLHKAGKGELRLPLPAGYEYDEQGAVRITPDEAVADAIGTVFAYFEPLPSARQVMLRLLEEQRKLPRRATGGGGPRWTQPTYKAIHEILTNPCYAGAYVYGRKRTEQLVKDGQVRDASAPRAARGVARVHPRPPRRLHLLRALPGQPGAAARQLASAARRGRRRRARGPSAAARADPLRALRPADAGRLQRQDARAQLLVRARQPALRHRALPVGRRPADRAGRARPGLRGAAPGRRSRRRCARSSTPTTTTTRACARPSLSSSARRSTPTARAASSTAASPRTGSSPARWSANGSNASPKSPRRARRSPRSPPERPDPLTDEEIAWCRQAGADLREVFDASTTSDRERKQLLRAILTEVVVTVDRESDQHVAELRVVWEGGAVTEHSVPLPRTGSHTRCTDQDTIALVRQLAERYPDKQIAAILARQGRRTGAGNPFTAHRVAGLRAHHKIPAAPVRPTAHDGDDGHDRERRQRARRLHRDRAPLATRRLHHRRADHARRALADPAHRRAARPRLRARARRLAAARRRRRRRSASPARPCCTRSNAASWPPSTSTAASEKAYESRSNPTKLDCSTNDIREEKQC